MSDTSTGALRREQLPMPDPPFTGKIGRTYQESEAAWPQLPEPPANWLALLQFASAHILFNMAIYG